MLNSCTAVVVVNCQYRKINPYRNKFYAVFDRGIFDVCKPDRGGNGQSNFVVFGNVLAVSFDFYGQNGYAGAFSVAVEVFAGVRRIGFEFDGQLVAPRLDLGALGGLDEVVADALVHLVGHVHRAAGNVAHVVQNVHAVAGDDGVAHVADVQHLVAERAVGELLHIGGAVAMHRIAVLKRIAGHAGILAVFGNQRFKALAVFQTGVDFVDLVLQALDDRVRGGLLGFVVRGFLIGLG